MKYHPDVNKSEDAKKNSDWLMKHRTYCPIIKKRKEYDAKRRTLDKKRPSDSANKNKIKLKEKNQIKHKRTLEDEKEEKTRLFIKTC